MKTGHCLCGGVRFAVEGDPHWVLHCHCESCRRATASPMTTFVSVADDMLHWSGTTPHTHSSSKGVERAFCAKCGSPIYYRYDGKPNETHLYVALFDEPEEFVPEGHDFVDEKVSWMDPLPAVTPKDQT